MNDGAKVLDTAIAFFECDRLCAPTLTLEFMAPASEEYDRLCPEGLVLLDRGEDISVDLGLPFAVAEVVDGDPDLEKGLLRFWSEFVAMSLCLNLACK